MDREEGEGGEGGGGRWRGRRGKVEREEGEGGEGGGGRWRGRIRLLHEKAHEVAVGYNFFF